MTSKRVLVIGGAGFLGSHLCDYYIAKGWDTICLDNESSGLAANVAHLMDHTRFTYMCHDINRDVSLDGDLDLVLHMASLASPPFYKKFPIDTLLVGSLGTLNALKLATRKNARIVLASTSEVYGDPQVSPQPESYWGHVNPIGPRSMYDESKRFSEALAVAFQTEHKTDVGIVRIFNTYGPKMHPNDGRVISNFIMQALLGRPITVFGDGLQTRSFCYVDDLIQGFIAFMNTPDNFPGPLNLGNPEEFKIIELAELIIDLTGTKTKINYKPLPSDDPTQRCPDISLAKEKLGWKPTVSLKEGLLKTIEYFEEQVRLESTQ